MSTKKTIFKYKQASGNIPTDALIGDFWYQTDTNKIYRKIQAGWVWRELGDDPTGEPEIPPYYSQGSYG